MLPLNTPVNTPPAFGWRAAAGLLVLGMLFGLFVLGAQPFAVNLVPSPLDKLAHVAAFAVLACAIGLLSGQRGRRMLLIAVAGALLIGVLDEWHQMFLPGRHAGPDDLAMDVIGSLLGAILLTRWRLHTARAVQRAGGQQIMNSDRNVKHH